MSVQFCCLAKNWAEVNPVAPTFLHFTPRLLAMSQAMVRAQVVLAAESEATAVQLLTAGASRVFLGEAALRDGDIITRLIQRFGPARVGLHVPVQRQAVSWSFDAVSNEDFNVVTPSLCEPVWEVLQADGVPSGCRAASWIGDMVDRGVQTVLVRADMGDDADLNLCAGMVELLGDKLWMAPLHDSTPQIGDWVNYGQVRQLALPTALYLRRHALLPRDNDARLTEPVV
ncbi:hypothetical protein [Rhodoferax sp.]|uniref:hypothetical protein n=1 Tax=Rhodoferax sp. TaxID=50421 RepID=UPI002602C21C|nr:hypothetical protein [Rhodoferax sp.]MDD2924746.1 hypothetical protein [Rhodoferax sp.]